MTKRQRRGALADFLPIRRKNAPVPRCRFSAIDPKSRALCSIALTFRSKCRPYVIKSSPAKTRANPPLSFASEWTARNWIERVWHETQRPF